MRYIGNKSKILNEIDELLKKKELDKKNLTFFDAFSGMGTVSDYLKNKYKIIANDVLYTSYIMSKAKLIKVDKNFEYLGFNPFDYFNQVNDINKGFIYNNYSLANSERMYFSEKNAGKIDFIRKKIEEWKNENRIDENQYIYLISCLLESVSKVANIAGVYGAYLKKWDNRALKDIKFIEIDKIDTQSLFQNRVYNEDIEKIIDDVNCDILYLDPPYTKNQYSTQYHLLETISLYDNPKIKGITGGREDSILKNSKFSKTAYVNIAFENIISKTKAKYIILSYSSDGIMSKEFIDAVLKRYGKKETYYFKKFNYRKYTNKKSLENDNHYEYLFFIEKKEYNDINYSSPLNYMGGKFEIIDKIKENLPNRILKFLDLFSGGFNVGINVEADEIIYNDINFKVKELIEIFINYEPIDIYKNIISIIKKYKLEKNNKEAYTKLREIYNKEKKNIMYLYTLILFGFQQQVRFNSKLEFNNPVGESSFNDSIFEKIISFSNKIKKENIKFYTEDFEFFENKIDKDTFVYLDPPYLITLGSYNDGKRGFNGWNESEEKRLLSFLKRLNEKGVKFMLSNVIEHKGKTNNILLKWINENNFNIKYFEKNKRKEVLIYNY